MPLFWAAPAPGGQGPGADSGSYILRSATALAPAPYKKRLLQAVPSPYTNIFPFNPLK